LITNEYILRYFYLLLDSGIYTKYQGNKSGKVKKTSIMKTRITSRIR